MGFTDFLFGTKDKIKQQSLLTGGQNNLLNSLLGQLTGQDINIGNNQLYRQGQDFLSGLLSGDSASYGNFAAPYMRQFNEQIIPGLAERFSGVGAQSSSAFANALGGAGAGLLENLASQREGLRFNALGKALRYAQQPVSNYSQLAQLGLGTQAFQNIQRPGTEGFLSKAISAAAPIALGAMTGGFGALAGLGGGSAAGAFAGGGLGSITSQLSSPYQVMSTSPYWGS